MKLTKKSRKTELLVAQGLEDFKSGGHRSLLKGWGGDLDSIRPWQPEDRRVAMSATAKTGEITAKVFEEPKLLTVWLVIDISNSMYFGSELSRSEAAAVILRVLGASVDHLGDLLGLVLFDDKVRQFSEAQRGGSFLGKTFDFIVKHQPAIIPTQLPIALRRLTLEKLDNALVIIISDFNFEVSEECLNLLQQINGGRNNSSLCLVLYDERELLFDQQRLMADICDAESRATLTWDMTSNEIAESLRNSFNEWQDQLKSQLRRVNSEILFLDISKNYIRDLAKFFSRKNIHAI